MAISNDVGNVATNLTHCVQDFPMEIEQVSPKSGKRTYSDGVALDTPDRRREREAQAGGREAELGQDGAAGHAVKMR